MVDLEDEDWTLPALPPAPAVPPSGTLCFVCWKTVQLTLDGRYRVHRVEGKRCVTGGRSAERVALVAKYGALRTLHDPHEYMQQSRTFPPSCWCGFSSRNRCHQVEGSWCD